MPSTTQDHTAGRLLSDRDECRKWSTYSRADLEAVTAQYYKWCKLYRQEREEARSSLSLARQEIETQNNTIKTQQDQLITWKEKWDGQTEEALLRSREYGEAITAAQERQATITDQNDTLVELRSSVERGVKENKRLERRHGELLAKKEEKIDFLQEQMKTLLLKLLEQKDKDPLPQQQYRNNVFGAVSPLTWTEQAYDPPTDFLHDPDTLHYVNLRTKAYLHYNTRTEVTYWGPPELSFLSYQLQGSGVQETVWYNPFTRYLWAPGGQMSDDAEGSAQMWEDVEGSGQMWKGVRGRGQIKEDAQAPDGAGEGVPGHEEADVAGRAAGAVHKRVSAAEGEGDAMKEESANADKAGNAEQKDGDEEEKDDTTEEEEEEEGEDYENVHNREEEEQEDEEDQDINSYKPVGLDEMDDVDDD